MYINYFNSKSLYCGELKGLSLYIFDRGVFLSLEAANIWRAYISTAMNDSVPIHKVTEKIYLISSVYCIHRSRRITYLYTVLLALPLRSISCYTKYFVLV